MWVGLDCERCRSIRKRLTRYHCGKATNAPAYGDVALAILLRHEQVVVMSVIHPDRQPSLLAICDRHEIEQRRHSACEMLLSPPDKCHRRPIIEPGRSTQQSQRTRPIRKRPCL